LVRPASCRPDLFVDPTKMVDKLKQLPLYRIGMVAVACAFLLALEWVRSSEFSTDELLLLATFLLGATGIEWGRSKLEKPE